ncbi:unnamed protein product [Caenorhabditis sp. 36 PRJEB53466]|nr:unnamed protein product [Caenorhabditis sp. 36 PRJEB53466]
MASLLADIIMNRQHFVSPQGRSISALFRSVRMKVQKKCWDMDPATQSVLSQNLLQKIGDIDTHLRHQFVRGNADPSILSPNVDVNSTIKRLFLRLERQAIAAAILADVAHIGPAANAEEQAALTLVENTLYVLDDAISPVSSLDRSATESD